MKDHRFAHPPITCKDTLYRVAEKEERGEESGLSTLINARLEWEDNLSKLEAVNWLVVQSAARSF